MNRSQSSYRVQKRGSSTSLSSRRTPRTTTTKSSGPYDRNFQQKLIDGGILPHAYRFPDGTLPEMPRNWLQIKERLARPRASLSPTAFSDMAHEIFVEADANALREKQVSESVLPIIEGECEDFRCTAGGIPFRNLDHLTNGTLVPGNPDRYHGARPEQLDPRVREDLDGHVVPSTNTELPILPNFVLALKGPDGSAAVAARQASYDGALGARAMHSLQQYGQERPVFDGNAYTLTSTYLNGSLRMFTSHPAQSADSDRVIYVAKQINNWGMNGTAATFREGATWYRNGRDWAKEQRDEAIRKANMRVNYGPAASCAADTSSGVVCEAPTNGSCVGEPVAQQPSLPLNTSLAAESLDNPDTACATEAGSHVRLDRQDKVGVR